MSLRFVFHEPGCSSLLFKAKQYSVYEMITGELSGPQLLNISPNPFFFFLRSKSEQRKCVLRCFQPGLAGAENRITLKLSFVLESHWPAFWHSRSAIPVSLVMAML